MLPSDAIDDCLHFPWQPPPAPGVRRALGHLTGNRSIENRQFLRPSLELLAERQPLHLVGGAYLDAVDFVGPRDHGTIDEPAHDLPMLDENGHFMRPYFQHGQCSEDVAQSVSESRIEEACVMDAELSDGRIVGDHFRCVVRRHANLFFGRQQIKITRIQNDAASGH